MKKILVVLSLIASAFIPVNAQANNKSLVIIDSYFQASIAQNPITASGAACSQVAPIKGATSSSPYSHGTAMYAVAKLQNPNLNIIPLCASNARSAVFPSQFVSALEWVKSNKDKVAAVSVSLTFNQTQTQCLPATPAKKDQLPTDKVIRSLINELQALGIPVFASAGNSTNKSVSYPSCISNTMGVAHANELGKPMAWSDSNTDYFVKLSNDGSKFNYTTQSMGLVAHTSSSATAAVAAMWVTNNVSAGVVTPKI